MILIFEKSLPTKDFSENDIDEHILKINETNEYHVERKSFEGKIKGQKFFKSKFINDFLFESDNLCNVFIAAKSRAKMIKKKKNKTSYDVTLSSNNIILFLHIVTDKKKSLNIFIIIRLYGNM